jgi:hypothetical protein
VGEARPIPAVTVTLWTEMTPCKPNRWRRASRYDYRIIYRSSNSYNLIVTILHQGGRDDTSIMVVWGVIVSYSVGGVSINALGPG